MFIGRTASTITFQSDRSCVGSLLRVYVCMCVYACVCMHVCVCVCMYACVCMRVCVCMCVRACEHVATCMCQWLCVYHIAGQFWEQFILVIGDIYGNLMATKRIRWD